MRLLLLLPFFILFLSGCNKNSEIIKKDDSQTNEIEKNEGNQKIFSSIIDENGKNLEGIIEDQTQIQKLIKSADKSALDLIDECIASQEQKGLPIYECTKLLKP